LAWVRAVAEGFYVAFFVYCAAFTAAPNGAFLLKNSAFHGAHRRAFPRRSPPRFPTAFTAALAYITHHSSLDFG